MAEHGAERRYTIGELAEAASVTTRTIRYYTAEDLLPPPDSRGKYALYGPEHLLRLKLIARLKDTYLPLGEIRARLNGLGIAERAELLRAPVQTRTASSAADYITQVLATRPAARVLEAPAPYAAPAPASAALPSAARPTTAPQIGVAEPLPSMAPDEARRDGGEQRWRRLTLTPEVELHLAEPLSEALQQRVDQLVAYAKRVLRTDDHDEPTP